MLSIEITLYKMYNKLNKRKGTGRQPGMVENMSKYFKSVKSYDDLKNQFKKLLVKNHPDNGGDTAVMQEINVEYDALFAIWKAKREKQTGEKVNETAESTKRWFYTQNGWEGSRYDSNLTTTQISKIIKTYCKEKYPTWKFSVTSKSFSGGSSINISVMEAPEQIFDLEYCRNEYKKYLEAEKAGYYCNSGICIDIEHMLANDSMHWQIHSIRDSYKEYFTEYGFAVLKDVYDFMESYNFDDSDGMIDYFSCNFYSSIYIGKWNKGFKVVPKTARIKKKPETTAPASTNQEHEYDIKPDQHTQTGADIWVVKIIRTLSREEYIQENKKMRSFGGYYSKFKHGFIFDYDPTEKLGII